MDCRHKRQERVEITKTGCYGNTVQARSQPVFFFLVSPGDHLVCLVSSFSEMKEIYLFIYLFSFFPVGRGTLLQVSPIIQQALLYEENWMTKSARVSQKLLSQGLPDLQVATRLLCADTRANKSIFQ